MCISLLYVLYSFVPAFIWSFYKGCDGLSRKFIFLFTVFVSRMCSNLELKNNTCGPQFRILREISSLEPAPKVWKPKYCTGFSFELCIVARKLLFIIYGCF